MTQTLDEPSTSELKPYRTSDTSFAAYLLLKGEKIIGTKQDPNDYKREICVFIYSEQIPELEQEWRYGKTTQEIKGYHRSLKILNRTINEARRAREQ